MMAGIYTYGIIRLHQVNAAVRKLPDMEVSLIQGNIDQSIKWDKKFKKETLNIYEQLSLKNLPGQGSLIVWPETAAPFKFQDLNSLHDQIVIHLVTLQEQRKSSRIVSVRVRHRLIRWQI